MGRDWNFNNYFYLIAGLIVLVAVFLGVNFIFNQTQDRASIVRLSGEVSIERDGAKITPTVGMVLNVQDKITTSNGASEEVTCDEGLKDIVRIGCDFHVVIENDVIQKQTSIFMDKGEIMLKLEKLEKGSNFKVRTPVAVAGVRGTSFGVKLKGKEAVVTDFESRIYVKGLNENFIENDDELLLNEGWRVRLAQFEKPSRVELIPSQERAAWLAWVNDVATLSSISNTQNLNVSTSMLSTILASIQDILLNNCPRGLSAMVMKMVSSASVLAFMLYIALMVNLRKVFA
ncbi:MAG: FecR domain-containing protein [Candidatus Omnitrophica bacterium]|nr:FecR domain-containing protein [Candidatus Omnitrophota bacterium]